MSIKFSFKLQKVLSLVNNTVILQNIYKCSKGELLHK